MTISGSIDVFRKECVDFVIFVVDGAVVVIVVV